jgi:hypothetical protein
MYFQQLRKRRKPSKYVEARRQQIIPIAGEDLPVKLQVTN